MSPEVDAYELCRGARAWAGRLAAGAARLEGRPELEPERAWLLTAEARVTGALEPFARLEASALALEPLASVRAARARALRGEVVDAVERMQAALLSARGPSAPLAEVLFEGTKLPRLRRASSEVFGGFVAELERRLGSSYVARQLEDEIHASVEPRAREVEHALAAWRALDALPGPSPEEAEALATELLELAARVDSRVRQARLLAEAAVLGAGELLKDLDLSTGPKRRARKRPSRSTGGRPPSAGGASAPPAE